MPKPRVVGCDSFECRMTTGSSFVFHASQLGVPEKVVCCSRLIPALEEDGTEAVSCPKANHVDRTQMKAVAEMLGEIQKRKGT